MSNRKIVLWVTHDSYVDHDIDVVPLISKIADIHWLVMLPYKNGRFKEEDFAHLDLSHNNKIHFKIVWKIFFTCIHFCLANNLVGHRIIKEARLRNDMLNLVCRCKEFS